MCLAGAGWAARRGLPLGGFLLMKVFHYERFFWLPMEAAGVRLPLGASFLRHNGSVRAKNTAGAEKALTFLQNYSKPPHVMTVC